MEELNVTLEDIQKARETIRSGVHFTPLWKSDSLSKRFNHSIMWKLEVFQHTGAFKVRGATNRMAVLTPDERKKGVVTASAGNHGQAVAWVGRAIKTPTTVVMPEGSPIVKARRCHDFGAKVILHGLTYDDAYQHALDISEKEGTTFIHAFDDPRIIAGQGTMALEINDHSPADTIVVPIGGGGLISGTAIAAKSLNPKTKIIGVVAQGAPAMANSFQSGKLQATESVNTIADGIAVKSPSARTFKLIQKLVDEVVTVTDEEIALAIVFGLEKGRFLLEGAGAVPLAALLADKLVVNSGTTVLALSGGNIDLNLLGKVIELGLCEGGRIFRTKLFAEDRPGVLNHLTGIFKDEKANILQVIHSRANRALDLNQTEIDLTIETSGPSHLQAIRERLKKEGWEDRPI